MNMMKNIIKEINLIEKKIGRINQKKMIQEFVILILLILMV